MDALLPNFLFQPLISIVVLTTIGNRFIYSFIVTPSLKWKSRRAETDSVLSSTAAVPSIFGGTPALESGPRVFFLINIT